MSRLLPLWRAPDRPTFTHPWREAGLALLAVGGVIALGQLWVRGIRLSTPGRWYPLAEAVNQIIISRPSCCFPSCGGRVGAVHGFSQTGFGPASAWVSGWPGLSCSSILSRRPAPLPGTSQFVRCIGRRTFSWQYRCCSRTWPSPFSSSARGGVTIVLSRTVRRGPCAHDSRQRPPSRASRADSGPGPEPDARDIVARADIAWFRQHYALDMTRSIGTKDMTSTHR